MCLWSRCHNAASLTLRCRSTLWHRGCLVFGCCFGCQGTKKLEKTATRTVNGFYQRCMGSLCVIGCHGTLSCCMYFDGGDRAAVLCVPCTTICGIILRHWELRCVCVTVHRKTSSWSKQRGCVRVKQTTNMFAVCLMPWGTFSSAVFFFHGGVVA